MTEPNVASSDAANIETRLTRIEERGSGDVSYLLNGEKWWSTGKQLSDINASFCPLKC